MKDFKKILRRYVVPVKLGDEEPQETQFQAKQLKIDLQRLRKSKDWAFFICTTMVVLAFFVSIGVVIALFRKPEQIAIIFSATGLTTAGLISVMRGIWKEKVAIELTIALLGNMRPESFESLLPVIMKKF